MYVVYLWCDFVTKMIIKFFWKSSVISGLWFGIVQFLNRNIQACTTYLTFTGQLLCQESSKSFFFFNSIMNNSLEAYLFKQTFLIFSIFETVYLLKSYPFQVYSQTIFAFQLIWLINNFARTMSKHHIILIN